jgi:hypothetical protein
MKDTNRIGCPKLDGPEVSQPLFYPRSSWKEPVSHEGVRDVLIPVGDGVSVGARFHTVNRGGPSILFFHGNGEIVEDYEDIAFLYIRMGLNFLPADYRGYGHSTGQPSVSTMLRDATPCSTTPQRLRLNGCTGPLICQGRSSVARQPLSGGESFRKFCEVRSTVSTSKADSPFPEHPESRGHRHETCRHRRAGGFRHREKTDVSGSPGSSHSTEFDHILPFSAGETSIVPRGLLQASLKIPAPTKKHFMVGLRST